MSNRGRGRAELLRVRVVSQRLGRRVARECHFENVLAIAPAIARRTTDVDIAQELHLDLLEAGSTTKLALSLARVEAEGACLETTSSRGIGLRKQLSDFVKCANVDRRVRARRFPKERLIHEHNSLQVLPASDSFRTWAGTPQIDFAHVRAVGIRWACVLAGR